MRSSIDSASAEEDGEEREEDEADLKKSRGNEVRENCGFGGRKKGERGRK